MLTDEEKERIREQLGVAVEGSEEVGRTLVGTELPPAELLPGRSYFPMQVEVRGQKSEQLVPRDQAAAVVLLHQQGYKRVVFGKNRRERRAEAARNR